MITQLPKSNGFLTVALWCALGAAFTAGCSVGPSSSGTRRINPNDVALPDGYRIEAVATGLTFPTGVAFDDRGVAYVTEAGYAWGGKRTKGRLLRIEPGGATTVVAEGDHVPWNGIDFVGGSFFVSQGAGNTQSDGSAGGRIVRIGADGAQTVVLDNLPSLGDHGTNGPRIGPDGWLYFAQGTATNSGVVGRDNAARGWIRHHPQFHDIPARDVTLTGQNFTATDPATGGRAVTGGFVRSSPGVCATRSAWPSRPTAACTSRKTATTHAAAGR
jgi:hypothetical protein